MLTAPLVATAPLCAPGWTLTSEFLTSSCPDGWMLNLPSAPDTGWPSFSQVMSGSGLPRAVQGRRAWEPSVVARSGRPVSITGGTVGTGRPTRGLGLGEGGLLLPPGPWHTPQSLVSPPSAASTNSLGTDHGPWSRQLGDSSFQKSCERVASLRTHARARVPHSHTCSDHSFWTEASLARLHVGTGPFCRAPSSLGRSYAGAGGRSLAWQAWCLALW